MINLDNQQNKSLYFTLTHENDQFIIIDVIIKKVALSERTSSLTVAQGEVAQNSQYVGVIYLRFYLVVTSKCHNHNDNPYFHLI